MELKNKTNSNPVTANTLISSLDGVDQSSTVNAEGGGICDTAAVGGWKGSWGGGDTGAREVIGCFNTTDKSAGIKRKVADHSS